MTIMGGTPAYHQQRAFRRRQAASRTLRRLLPATYRQRTDLNITAWPILSTQRLTFMPIHGAYWCSIGQQMQRID
jgi:hypothetical protein